MANFTATTTTRLSGRPGSSAGAGLITVTVVPNEGYRVLANEISIDNSLGYFENITSTQSGSNVVITFDLVDDIQFPGEDSSIGVTVTGEARPIGVGIDGCVKFDDSGRDDIDIILHDDDGNPIDGDTLLFDEDDVMEGDEVVLGDVSINPVDGDFPDSDGDGSPDEIDTDALGLDPPFHLGDGDLNDDGGWTYDIIIVVPDDGGEGIGEDMDPVDVNDVVFVDDNGNPTGGDVTPDGSSDVLSILSIDVNSDNVDPVNGGFIVITATGDPGATGTVTITPTVRGGVTIDPTPEVINANIEIEDNGVDVITIRIPAPGGEEFVNNDLCAPDLPDDFDGIDWGIEVVGDTTDEDGNPIDEVFPIEVIDQGFGSAVCFSIVSADGSIPDSTDGVGTAVTDGWRYDYVIGPSTPGFSYPNGHIRVIIPSGSSNWNLLGDDNNDGIVELEDGTDYSRQSSFDSGSIFCNGVATLDTNGNLVIDIDYTGGTFQNGKVQYDLDLDNIATLNTEVQLFFEDGPNYTVSQTEFAYSGMPGTAVPADGGEVPTSVTFTVEDGYTWHDTNLVLTVNNIIADLNNDATNNIASISISPSLATLQGGLFVGTPRRELTISWTLGGNFPDPMVTLANIYNVRPIGAPRFISTVNFDFGTQNTGHDTLEDATFLGVTPVTGIEGRSWSTQYNIVADADHVFKQAQLPIGVHFNSTFGATVGQTVPVSTDPIVMVEGTISGTFGHTDDTVQIDGQGQGFREVTVSYLVQNNVQNTSLEDAELVTVTGIEGDPIPMDMVSIIGNTGFGLRASNNITAFAGTEEVFPTFLHRFTRGAFFNRVQYGLFAIPTSDTRVFSDEDEQIVVRIEGDASRIPIVVDVPLDLDDIDGLDTDNLSTEPMNHLNDDGDIEVEGDGGEVIRIVLCIPTDSGFAIQEVSNLDLEFPDNVTVVSTELRNTDDDATDMGDNNILCYTLDIEIPDDATGGDEVTTDPIDDEDMDSSVVPLVSLEVFFPNSNISIPSTLLMGPNIGDSVQFDVVTESQGLTPPGWTSENGIAPFWTTTPSEVTTDTRTTVSLAASSSNGSIVDTRQSTILIRSRVDDVLVSRTISIVQGVAEPSITAVSDVVTTRGVGGTGSITFTVNDTWVLDGLDETRFTASSTAGSAGTFTITFTNVTDFALQDVVDSVTLRTTTLQTSTGEAITPFEETFTITHPSFDETLTSSSASIMLNQQGDQQTVSINANLDGWTFSPTTIEGITITRNGNNLEFSATPNTGFININGIVTVTSQLGSHSVHIAVSQEALAEILTVSTNNVSIPTAGGQGTVTVTHNNGYDVTIDNLDNFVFFNAGDVDSPGGVVTENVVTIARTEGAGFEDHSATITFRSHNLDNLITRIVNVSQAGMVRTFTGGGTPFTPTSGPVLDFENTGATDFVFAIESNDPNMTWTAAENSDPDNIIGLTATAGTNGSSVQFNVAENGIGEPAKTGSILITFFSAGGEQVGLGVITVNLAAGEPITFNITPTSPVSVTNTAQDVTFNLASNLNGSQWIVFAGDNPFGDVVNGFFGDGTPDTVTFSIPSNDTTGNPERSFDIVFTHRTAAFATISSTTITINQAAGPIEPATEFAFSPTNYIGSGASGGAAVNVLANGGWVIPLTYQGGNNRFGGLVITSSDPNVQIGDDNLVTGTGNASLTFTTSSTVSGQLVTGGATVDGINIDPASSQINRDSAPLRQDAYTFGGSEFGGTLTDISGNGGTGTITVSGTAIGVSGLGVRLGSGTSDWITGLSGTGSVYTVNIAANDDVTSSRTGTIVLEGYEATNSDDGSAITDGFVIGTSTITVTQQAAALSLMINGESSGTVTIPTFLDGGTVGGASTGYTIELGAGNTGATHYFIHPSGDPNNPASENWAIDNNYLLYMGTGSPYVRAYYESAGYDPTGSSQVFYPAGDPGFVWPITALDGLAPLVPIDNDLRLRLRYHDGFTDRTNTINISLYSSQSRSDFIGTVPLEITQAANAGTVTLTIGGVTHQVTDNLETIVLNAPANAFTDGWEETIEHTTSLTSWRAFVGSPNSPVASAFTSSVASVAYGFDSDLGYATRGLGGTSPGVINWVNVDTVSHSNADAFGFVAFQEDLRVRPRGGFYLSQRVGDTYGFERRVFFHVYWQRGDGTTFRTQRFEIRQPGS